jgi:hypothetical protein
MGINSQCWTGQASFISLSLSLSLSLSISLSLSLSIYLSLYLSLPPTHTSDFIFYFSSISRYTTCCHLKLTSEDPPSFFAPPWQSGRDRERETAAAAAISFHVIEIFFLHFFSFASLLITSVKFFKRQEHLTVQTTFFKTFFKKPVLPIFPGSILLVLAPICKRRWRTKIEFLTAKQK